MVIVYPEGIKINMLEGATYARMTLKAETRVWYHSGMDMKELCGQIRPLKEEAMQDALRRLDSLAKPPGSLGALEQYAVKLAGITGAGMPDITRRAILIFSADNGVCDEGIGSAPQSVTCAQTVNFVRGLTGVATLAKAYHADLIVADMGMNAPVAYPGIHNLRVRAGTGNIRIEDAMTRAQAEQAILAGAALAMEAARDGFGLLGVGEMGIGNTTTSTAVLAVLTGQDSDGICGMGGGIGERRMAIKRQVLRDAIVRAQANPQDTVEVLAKLGGLDICAMAGAYLGAAAVQVPVVVDGLIGCVAALCAVRIAPDAAGYLFASHASQEPGAKLALDALGMEAPLHLHMRLGEGSGCPLMFSLLDGACAIYSNMATFEEAQIDDGYLEEIKR